MYIKGVEVKNISCLLLQDLLLPIYLLPTNQSR